MMTTSIEQTMRTLKLGGLAKEWRSVVYYDNEQYLRDLLEICHYCCGDVPYTTSLS